jgi:hypothetical protein
MAIRKKANWGGIWKSIKQIDKDSNGFVTSNELEEIFREWFPVELDGKTLSAYFRNFKSIQNKQLINYKLIKEKINQQLLTTRAPIENNDEKSPTHHQPQLSLNKSALVLSKPIIQ